MSFINDYRIYACKDEAPDMFHILSGYVALSSAIGRRVWIANGENAFFANIYVLLIGGAGCGKNQAINKCTGLLDELGTVATSADVDTPEGLLRYIAGQPDKDPPIPSDCARLRKWRDGKDKEVHELTIFATEFIDFIRIDPEKWTGLFNNIYDKDTVYKYRTKGQGTDIITGPYIVLLGGIPSDVQAKLQDIDVISTGFARRTFLQYGERKYHEPHAFPEWSEEEQAARTRCLTRLKEVQTLKGEMVMTPDARVWYKQWYDEHITTIPQRATPAIKGWMNSKSTQVQKLAMLNSLSDRDDLLITPDDFERATGCIDIMESTFNMIFGGLGRNELAALVPKVFEYLHQTCVPAEVSSLFTHFFTQLTSGKGYAELNEVLQHLAAIGKIQNKTLIVKSISHNLWGTPEAFEKFERELREPPPADPSPST